MYQGHHADGSGIQNHSCGPIYPYVIGYTERGGYAVLTPPGAWIDCGTYDAAYEKATTLKAQDTKLH